MKKFKFLFLATLIAVMSIGCAQPTDDDTPIISDAQPTVVNVTVIKITDSNNYVLSDSGSEIREYCPNSTTGPVYTVLNTSTPIGDYTNVSFFFPDEIELEYSNGEKRIVSIINNNIFSFSKMKFNGLLDIFLNGLDIGNTTLKWTTFYKYK